MNLPNTPLNRRDFLTQVVGRCRRRPGAGRPEHPQGRPKGGSADKIHVALIGFGKQGGVLFDAMKNIPGLHFQAVCDIWDYSRQKAMGTIRNLQDGRAPAGYSDIDEMLATEKGLDAVIVATPDFWHSPHTVKCLDAGLHVYCEKMMSNTIDDAREMVRAMERDRQALPDRPPATQQPALPLHPRPVDQRQQDLRPDHQRQRPVEPRGRRPPRTSPSTRSWRSSPRCLEQYGFKDMHQFLNWRCSTGPVRRPDLRPRRAPDRHLQLVLRRPAEVGLRLRRQRLTSRSREHFDNVMAIFDYDTPQGGVRAFYQVLTTTSAGGGYFETFMGTEATIKISEIASSPRSTARTAPRRGMTWSSGAISSARTRRRSRSHPMARSLLRVGPAGGLRPARRHEQAGPPAAPRELLRGVRDPRQGEAQLRRPPCLRKRSPDLLGKPVRTQRQPITFTPEQLSV